MANKKLSELTTATGQTTSWVIPICDTATGLTYKITAAALSTLIGGGGGDVTAPTVVSAIAATATTIVVTFSESVTVTTAGWSFKKNGSAWTIVNVTGSGTSWTFNMATSAVLGDTLLRTYDSGTGATVDASANELASFTDSSITNSIGDTTAPTVVSATATTATNVQIVFSETVTVTTAGWSFKLNGAAWSISSVSGSGTTWNFTMGSAAVSTDTLLRSYDSTTGATVDNAANELVSFTDSAVTNSVPALELLVFSTSNGLSASGNNIEAANTATLYANWGVATKSFANGVDGYVQTIYTSADGENAMIAVDTDNTDERANAGTGAIGPIMNYKAAAYVYAGTLYYLEENVAVTSSGVTLSTGDYWRINRTGSVWKLQYSTTAGASWSDAHTYTFTSTAQVYIKACIDNQTNANSKLYSPKGYNVS